MIISLKYTNFMLVHSEHANPEYLWSFRYIHEMFHL